MLAAVHAGVRNANGQHQNQNAVSADHQLQKLPQVALFSRACMSCALRCMIGCGDQMHEDIFLTFQCLLHVVLCPVWAVAPAPSLPSESL